MATTRKKPTKKQSAQKVKGRLASLPPKSGLRNEVAALAIIAASVFIIYSLIIDGAGAFGRLVNSVLLGLFGIGAYIAPACAIMISVLLFLNKKEFLAKSKLIMEVILFLLIISFAHTFSDTDVSEMGFLDSVRYLYDQGGGTNGGLFGAVIANFFVGTITRAGTYLLFFTVSAILIIQLSNKSLFYGIAALAGEIGRRIRDYRDSRYDYDDDGHDEDDYYEEPPPPRRRPAPPPVIGRRRKRNHVLLDDHPATDEAHEEKFEPDDDEVPDKIITNGNEGEMPRITRRKLLQDDVTYLEPPKDDWKYGHEAIGSLFDGDGDFEPPEEISARLEAAEAEEPTEISLKGNIEGYTPVAVSLEAEAGLSWEEPASVPIIPISSPGATLQLASDIEQAEYIFPPVELLRESDYVPSPSSRAQVIENSRKLEETLRSFGVAARVVEVCRGPTVTRYELSPGSGVKVSKISGLADDLALNLAAAGIRIEAPVPGKSVVGIEIPNKEVQAVCLREVIDDEAFWSSPSKVSFAMGKDIAGNIVIADIAKMPHLLIAGATGAGKSVCINTLIASIIYKATPSEVKLLMIDPKVVELSVYNGIPHLLIPVVTDPKKASGALNWAVREMDLRYNMFAETRKRDLKEYNSVLAERGEQALPQIVIIIDELADLMMTCGKEVEESICRLAQKARAAGIHLIIATQRPSVDVITGLIKANVPSRLAFAVSSGTDSRTILDMVGAEKLLGKGDMLFSPVGLSKPQRIQGSFISDKEVENIVNFVKTNAPHTYDEEMIEKITAAPEAGEFNGDSDEFYLEAVGFVVERGKASTSMLQRRFRIGYNRAARIMEELEDRGIVGPEEGSKPREVRMTSFQYREYMETQKL